MDTTDIIYNCAQKLDCDARRFEPMSRHTSFKIGGKADVYIKVTNLSQLMKILKECDVCKEKYILLGNGSNVLFRMRESTARFSVLTVISGIFH